MLTQERRKRILEILNQTGSIEVSELSEELGASESTIRRDIIFLSNLGKLHKVHGGATLLSQEFAQNEESFDAKTCVNVDEKTAIAKYAASLISDDDFVYLDAGSSTFLLAKLLEKTNARFVTNGISQAKELAKKGIEVTLLGGELRQSTDAIVGIEAAMHMQKYNFSKAFIGANGISEKQGYTTPVSDEGVIKSIAIERSFISYILCDSTKFNKVSGYSFSKIDACCIITTRCKEAGIKKRTVVKEVQ